MNCINGQTQILGLLGQSIEHSHSFRLHNFCLQSLGLNAVYLPFQTQTETFETLFSLDHFVGANVTMPFKTTIQQHVHHVTETARNIGAINTIYKQDQKIIGDNTDAIGFTSSLKAYNIPWTARNVYIIGAGGAAKAVCHALAKLQVTHVRVWNRSLEKIETLSQEIQVARWDLSQPSEPSIIIQCTPLGRLGEDPIPNICFDSTSIVVDLLYQHTPLLERVQQAGGLAINGLGMLIHQAAHSFGQWFQCSPPIAMMESIPEIRIQLEKSA